jgi:hypothetical protein
LLIAHSLNDFAAACLLPWVCDSSPSESLLLAPLEESSLLLSVLLPAVNTWDHELPISQLTA